MRNGLIISLEVYLAMSCIDFIVPMSLFFQAVMQFTHLYSIAQSFYSIALRINDAQGLTGV